MPRTRVKICGMMRPEDAACAQRLGADAIGLIFHPPARRYVSIEQARKIIDVLGPFVTPVGVFLDAATKTILETANAVALHVAQLHGNEPAEQVEELGRAGLKVIKAVRVDSEIERELEKWRELRRRCGALVGLVLETAGTSGGSGKANDWDRVRQLQNAGAFAALPPIIAAGGITPENVSEVMRLIRPWAVDTSSGVEAVVGEKAEERIEAMMREVLLADREINRE